MTLGNSRSDRRSDRPHPSVPPSVAPRHRTHGPRVVVRSDLAVPPPQTGDDDSYIVPAGAAGEWAGHVGEIACDASRRKWTFEEPAAGWQVYDQAARATLLYHDGAWWRAAEQVSVDTAQAGVDAALAGVGAAQAAADAARADATAAHAAAAAAHVAAEAAQSRVAALDPAVATLQSDVAGMGSAIAQQRADVDAIEAKTLALEGELENAQADIADLKATVALASQPSVYFGQIAPGVGAGPWNSTTYAAVIGGPIGSFVDGVQNRISRTGSVFTFTDGGTYLVNLHLPAVAGSLGFVSFRLQGSSGAVLAEHATQVGNIVAYYPAALVITVAAAEEVTLQYAVSTSTGQYNPGPTINGQVTSIGHIAIHRLY